jgi:hypothetical protein
MENKIRKGNHMLNEKQLREAISKLSKAIDLVTTTEGIDYLVSVDVFKKMDDEKNGFENKLKELLDVNK